MREADQAPLQQRCHIVAIEVGLNPSTALIRKGCRLRVDVQPYSPAGLPNRAYDESLPCVGATNTIHTGPDSSELHPAADRSLSTKPRLLAQDPA